MARSSGAVFDTASLTVRRRTLLARIAAARPQILAIVAPAGFGKTSLMRQIVGERSGVGICDCALVGDEIDFARRIVAALETEEPARSGRLAQTELLLADGAISENERLALALAAWQSRVRATIVFENAEHVTAPGPRDFFAKLLAGIPDGRTIVICSRTALPMRLSRFAAPHRILTLRAPDLEFDESELREALGGSGLSEPALERIRAVSQGWPIAVFLLARFASEGRLEELLDRLDDVAFEDLHDYLAEHVLRALDPDIAETLFAATCIANATESDLVYANEGAAFERFAEFARTSPFVDVSRDGTYRVHPLLGSTLLHLEASSRERVLRATAARMERAGEYLRAAEVHLTRGDVAEAARLLECVPVAEDHAPSMRYAHALASLDRSLVKRYPTLWATSAVLQMFATDSEQLLEENGEIWRVLAPETPAHVRYYIFITRVLLLTFLGRFEEARSVVESVAPRESLAAMPTTTVDGYALYLHGNINARAGRLALAERDLRAALPLVSGMDILGSGTLMILGADVARGRGERVEERRFLERAVAAALPSELDNIISQRDAEAVFGAWLAGETLPDGDGSSLGRLVRACEERGVRGFAFFVERLLGRPWRDPDSGSLLKWTICGYLVACAESPEREAAESLALRALEAARRNATPFMIVLAALASAERAATPARRSEALDEAAAAAAAIESPALHDAIRRVRAGAPSVGMLDAFVTHRLRAVRCAPAASISLAFLSGSASQGDAKIAFTKFEFALVVALARQDGTTSRRTLTDLLWPDLDEERARNRLHATLHRLRERFASAELIVADGTGYRLAAGVVVDLWEIERRVRALRTSSHVSGSERAEFRTVLDRLAAPMPHFESSWEWLEAMRRRIKELASELGAKLARCALADDCAAEALEIAEILLARDACDEPAQEVAIRARIQLGDRVGAVRHFRQFQRTLRAELDCEPSPELAALVAT